MNDEHYRDEYNRLQSSCIEFQQEMYDKVDKLNYEITKLTEDNIVERNKVRVIQSLNKQLQENISKLIIENETLKGKLDRIVRVIKDDCI